MPIPANDNQPLGASIRYRVEPRLVPSVKAARRLHLTEAEFSAKRAALRAAGFPAPCPVTGHYDLLAIDRWIDSMAESPGRPATPIPDFATRLARLG